MILRSRFPLGVVLAVLPALMLLVTTPVVAQPTERPCVENVAPVDDFQSAGLGLTREELIALYGEEGIGQGSIFYDFRGFDLHKVGCDLILAFPLTGVEVGQVIDEAALAEALLPADAEFVGSFAQGTTIFLGPPVSLWRSASLAERFAEMGENRGGDILIVYTYQFEGFEQGPIQQVELRTLELPE